MIRKTQKFDKTDFKIPQFFFLLERKKIIQRA